MTHLHLHPVNVVVYGTPAPQGSKSARPIYAGKGTTRRFTGKVAQVESSAKVKPWRDDVKAAVENQLPPDWQPWDCPLFLHVAFTLHKPTSAPKKRRTWPMKTPDLDKLLRSTCDAITAAGVWADDARVIGILAGKHYVGEDCALERPGARIQIALAPEYAATLGVAA